MVRVSTGTCNEEWRECGTCGARSSYVTGLIRRSRFVGTYNIWKSDTTSNTTVQVCKTRSQRHIQIKRRVSVPTMTSFLDLPDEVIIRIATYVDIKDVVNLRKVCRRCSALSHERAIWKSILQSQSKRYPLPRSASSLEGQTKGLEELAASVHVTARSWLRRQRPALVIRRPTVTGYTRDLMYDVHMVSDRWLVAILTGFYEVWDLYPSDEPEEADYIGLSRRGAWARGTTEPIRRLRDGIDGNYIFSVACVDPSGDAIILAITCLTEALEKQTTVRKIRPSSNMMELQLLGSISSGPHEATGYLAVDPSSQLVAFSDEGKLRFWHWPTDFCWNVPPAESELDEAAFHASILAVYFLTPRHLLCLHKSKVDLLTLNFLDEVSGGNPGQREEVKQFRGLRTVPRISATFSHLLTDLKRAKFSEPQTVYSERSKTVTLTFLTRVFDCKLRHYAVEARFPHSSETCSSMALPTPGDFTHIPLDVKLTLLAAREDIPGSSGIIRECALGSQRKRGVWAEQLWDTLWDPPVVGWRIYVFAVDEHEIGKHSKAADDNIGPTGSAVTHKNIQGRTMYEIKDIKDVSILSDDNLSYCAVSEVTGTVVLGTIRGQLLVLNWIGRLGGLITKRTLHLDGGVCLWY
ncbi:hypothetical protein BC835DRAFT_302791 [Cytidiella melzeri]|nr:hypothetical protein BC835DRAFT_302791 [Cytidiella melzeri]